MIYPTIVGEGKHMFGSQSELTMMKLADSRSIGPGGTFVLTYIPAG
jgi:hypothetical protein